MRRLDELQREKAQGLEGWRNKEKEIDRKKSGLEL